MGSWPGLGGAQRAEEPWRCPSPSPPQGTPHAVWRVALPKRPFAGQQQGQNRDWPPTVAVTPRPRPGTPHPNSDTGFLIMLPHSSANRVGKSPLHTPKAAGREAGREPEPKPHHTPPQGCPAAPTQPHSHATPQARRLH